MGEGVGGVGGGALACVVVLFEVVGCGRVKLAVAGPALSWGAGQKRQDTGGSNLSRGFLFAHFALVKWLRFRVYDAFYPASCHLRTLPRQIKALICG